MQLSKLEKDFLGDLAQDSHELWELYTFIRLHYPEFPEDKIIRYGRELLTEWVGRGWLKISQSRGNNDVLSGDELLAMVDNLGEQADDPRKGTILLDLTDRAAGDLRRFRSLVSKKT
jgi:hypothetical protein